MITKIAFKKFGIFQSDEWVEIPLNLINVFVGPNGSGKSTVLKFIRNLVREKDLLLPYTFDEHGYFSLPFNFSIEFDDEWAITNSGGDVLVGKSDNEIVYWNSCKDLLKLDYPHNPRVLNTWTRENFFFKIFVLKEFTHPKFLEKAKDEIKLRGFKGDIDDLIKVVVDNVPKLVLHSHFDIDIKNYFLGERYEYYPKNFSIENFLNPFFSKEDLPFAVQLVDIWTNNIEFALDYTIKHELRELELDFLGPVDLEKLWNQRVNISDTHGKYFTNKIGTKEKYPDYRHISFDCNMKIDSLQHGEENSFHYSFDLKKIESEFSRITGKEVIFSTWNKSRFYIKINREKRHFNIGTLSRGELKLMELLFVLHQFPKSNFNYPKNQKPGQLTYWNEPEISMHPAWQSRLSKVALDRFNLISQSNYKGEDLNNASEIDNKDFLGRRAVSYDRIIIETHSEYLILGLQYEAAKLGRPQDIQILYFDGKGNVTPIEITKDGTLTRPFGPGFYDESERLSSLILQNMVSKS
jgi:hypothetical protein